MMDGPNLSRADRRTPEQNRSDEVRQSSDRTTAPGTACGSCASPARISAGESLIDGRIEWYLETDCPHCGSQTIACGRDMPPDSVRSKLLELTGSWVARIDTAPTTSVMRVLRKVYGATLAEARELTELMRAEGLPGTHGEVLFVSHQLALLGIEAHVVNVAPGTGA